MDQSVFESQNFLNRKGRKEAQRKTREILQILQSVSKIFPDPWQLVKSVSPSLSDPQIPPILFSPVVAQNAASSFALL
jgi:hypothetical protein